MLQTTNQLNITILLVKVQKKGTARGRIQVAFTTQLCPSVVMPAHVQCCIFGAKATSNFHSLLSGCSPMFISWLNHVDSPCN
jgi:hypothetical protein